MELIKKTEEKEIKNLILELIYFYMKSVGQSNAYEEIVNITFLEFSDYILKKCQSYTPDELREGLRYGRDNDEQQGGGIHAQRLIFWMKKYHKDVWVKRHATSIANGKFFGDKEPKQIAASKEVSLSFIKDQQKKYKKKEFALLAVCYETLKNMGHFKVNNQEKWAIVERAKESIIRQQNELQDIYKYKKAKNEMEAVIIGEQATVTGRVKAECHRIMVADLFKNTEL